MSILRFDRNEDRGLTRISVSSTRDRYLVRHGDEPVVTVHRRGRSLECECGYEECTHIQSLQLCGFIDSAGEMPRAA